MPELRTDYISGMTEAYQRGQRGVADLDARKSALSTAAQNRMINDAKLDEYYKNKKFEEGFSDYYAKEKEKNKDATMEESLEKYSMEHGRLDIAMKARDVAFKKRQEQRQRLSSFAQVIGQLWSQGAAMGDPKAFLAQMGDQVKAQFPEFDDYDPSAIKEVDAGGWVTTELKNDKGKVIGDAVLHPGGKSFFVPKKLPTYKVVNHPVMLNGKKRFMAVGTDGSKKDLGPWTEEMGTGDKDAPSQVRTWQWMMMHLGITKAQLKQFILSGKTKTDREIAIDIAKKLAGSDLGPIEWTTALKNPKGPEAEKLNILISIIESGVRGERDEIESEESTGLPPGVPKGSIKGTYQGQKGYMSPDGKKFYPTGG